jgi:hypothetical protein
MASQEVAAGADGIREPGEPPEVADAAASDAARRLGTKPAASRDRAAAEPAERKPAEREPAEREPAEREPAEREPAEQDKPAGPEQASAVAERAPAKDAAAAGLQRQDEPSAGSASSTIAESATGDGHAAEDPGPEVTVVPGISRYHRSECILIRFLGAEDLATMTLQAAEVASYVPCKACRPEQELAGD